MTKKTRLAKILKRYQNYRKSLPKLLKNTLENYQIYLKLGDLQGGSRDSREALSGIPRESCQFKKH